MRASGRHFFLESPIGLLTLVQREGSLTGLYMDAHLHVAREAFGTRTQSGFEAVVEQLQEYFAGQRTEFTIPVAPAGTAFQRSVWDQLTRIPYGETRTYSEVAKAIGKESAVRAVGAANGQNPISIVVPCHRVIGSDGRLVGYGGGLERKRFLLDLENPGAAREASLF